jgi:hypothetical protein
VLAKQWVALRVYFHGKRALVAGLDGLFMC